MSRFPHTYVVMAGLIAAAALLTHVIPGGRYDRADIQGRRIAIEDSFHAVPSQPAGISDVLLALPRGLAAGSDLVFCFLIIGGALGVFTRTGAVNSLIGWIAVRCRGRGELMIISLMCLFSLGGGTIGVAGEVLPFLPGLVILARRHGYDDITGGAIALLGAGAGVAGAFLDPFSVGLAQKLAGLPLFSGIALRLVAWGVITSISILYVVNYARRVHREANAVHTVDAAVPPRHALLVALLLATAATIFAGAANLEWGLTELAAVYLGFAIASGLVGGLSPNETAEAFADGAASMTSAALVVGLARSVSVIFDNANATDTILNALVSTIDELPASVSVVGIYLAQIAISFVIPSGTGQAALTIPILSPLGDMVGVTRQTTVLAFQFGDAFSNVVSPTVGYFMAALAVLEIEWARWVKFAFPLFALWCLVGLVFVFGAHAAGYGPF